MSHLTTGLIFFPSSFQMRGVNLTFTVRSKRSLENENSEAVQMQTLATVDLFINSLEEHHELQKEGNFLHPPQVCCLGEHSGMLEFAFLHTRRPAAENEVKATGTAPDSAVWHQLQLHCGARSCTASPLSRVPPPAQPSSRCWPSSLMGTARQGCPGENPDPGQPAGRRSASKESLPGCLQPSLPAPSNLKCFSLQGS